MTTSEQRALAPIERLPVEILMHIFADFELEDFGSVRQASKALCHVLEGYDARQLLNRLPRHAYQIYAKISSKPFLHNRALLTGMPHSIKWLPISGQPLGLDDTRLILSSRDPVRAFDLHAEQEVVLKGVHYVNGHMIPSTVFDRLDIPDDSTHPIVARYEDRYCHWSTRGVHMYHDGEVTFTEFDFLHKFSSGYACLTDEYLFLVGYSREIYKFRFRLCDMQRCNWVYYPDLRNPSVIPAGLGLIFTNKPLRPETEYNAYFFDFLNDFTLVPVDCDGKILAVWRYVAYTVSENKMFARSLSVSRDNHFMMARFNHAYEHLLVNDRFMVGFGEGEIDHTDVYTMDPDLTAGRSLYRLPRREVHLHGTGLEWNEAAVQDEGCDVRSLTEFELNLALE